MKTFLGILLACCVPVSAWAAWCGPRYLYELHVFTQNVYPDSVFWLKVYPGRETDQLNVRNMQFQQLGQRGTGYKTVTHYPYGIMQLRPKKPLQEGLRYTFTSKTPLEKLQYQADKGVTKSVDTSWVDKTLRGNTFTVSPAVKLPLPIWEQYPELYGVRYSDSTAGQDKIIEWKLKTNLQSNDYLVYTHLARQADFSDAQGFLNFITGGSTLIIGYDACKLPKEKFDFQFGETIWAKFDLISHNGVIVPWQGEPMKFELRETEPDR